MINGYRVYYKLSKGIAVAYIRIYTTKKAAKPVIDCSLKPLKGLVIP